MRKDILFTDNMSKKDITCYIVLDREIADHLTRKEGRLVKHGLSDHDVRILRRAMRRLGRYQDENEFDYVQIKGEGYDSTTWKKFFPNEFFTKEEQKEIMDEMWIHALPSQYDCTGQEFTWAIYFFKVPNGTWIYHRKGYDV